MTSERLLERESELDHELVEQRALEIRSKVPVAGMGPGLCGECSGSIHPRRRALGFKYSNVFFAQDYAGTEGAGEKDAEQVFANTRFKFFGALEEAITVFGNIRMKLFRFGTGDDSGTKEPVDNDRYR